MSGKLDAWDAASWPADPPGEKMLIGKLKNGHVRRFVKIYYVDAHTVYTVGQPYDGGPNACFYEPRAVFEEVIDMFPEVVVWSAPPGHLRKAKR